MIRVCVYLVIQITLNKKNYETECNRNLAGNR